MSLGNWLLEQANGTLKPFPCAIIAQECLYCIRASGDPLVVKLVVSSSISSVHSISISANPVYLVNYRDCLKRCGGRGGPCQSCGPNGYCCQRGEMDCPPGYRSSAPPGRYACVLKMKH